MKAVVKIIKVGKKIIIEGTEPLESGKIRIDLFSHRNSNISKLSDISPDNPDQGEDDPNLIIGEIGNSEIWYPVVDVALEKNMTGKVEFGAPNGTYAVNGMFHQECFDVKPYADIPYTNLEHWENSIFIKPAGSLLNRFYISIILEIDDSVKDKFRYEVRLLSSDWSGRVDAFFIDNEEESQLASAVIENTTDNSFSRGEKETRTPESALRHCIEYILNSQNDNPLSKTANGLNLFYDLEAKTYRTTSWIWSWGPAIKLILDYADTEFTDASMTKEFLLAKADEMGMKSTMFQVNRPGHVTDGLGSTRWDPKHFSNVHNDYGYIELIAGGADSNFLSGWVWIPLYEKTGNKHYLECAEKLTRTTDRLINQYDIAPQDYISDIDEWTDRTLNESVFGMEGLAEIYLSTKSEEFKKTGKKYIDQHIDKLYREDGLWDFFYYNKTGKRELIKNTRGQGWAMEGLLAAHKMMPEGVYLELAEQLAEHIIKNQHSEGYVTCVYDEPAEIVGKDDKSTPLWSMLLYRLYRYTKKDKHLNAARKALYWCLKNQYLGSDEHAWGGLVGVNRFSGVVSRDWFPITCLYSTAFFGHALLEEIGIQNKSNK